MWFPVNLHSSASKSGKLAEAVIAKLEEHQHYHTVEHRKIVNHACRRSMADAATTFAMIDRCSHVYIGIHHNRVFSPYCAFTVSPELGIAYLEHLIGLELFTDSKSDRMNIMAYLLNFVSMLFNDSSSISIVVSPLPIWNTADKFIQSEINGLYHIKRSEH